MYTHYLSWLLLAPLILSLAGFAFYVLRQREILVAPILISEGLHVASITAMLIFSLLVLQGVFVEGSVVALNDWLHVDALAAVFLMIVSVVGFLVGIYSLGYIRNDVRTGEMDERAVSMYYALFNLFLFTMLLVVTANNIIMMVLAAGTTSRMVKRNRLNKESYILTARYSISPVRTSSRM